MHARFLKIRLNDDVANLIDRLQEQTSLDKSELVRRALLALERETSTLQPGGLFELGKARFGRHGDATRQAVDIKRVVRARLHVKCSA